MAELPDYRGAPSVSPEGDAIAVERYNAWARDHLDPIIDPEPPAKRYGIDRLAEVDRDRMAARVIKECELIGFWLAWHRAGGFTQLERGGWDRSTIYRKLRRFRFHFGIHPDDARFPWLDPDWSRAWAGDRQVALEWAFEYQKGAPDNTGAEDRWRPTYALRSDPHELDPEDPFNYMDAVDHHPSESDSE